MISNLETLKKHIPQISQAISIEQIHKGYSRDGKFIVTLENNKKYILRTADITLHDKKQLEYQHIQRLREYRVQTSEPIVFGQIDDFNLCYMLLSYIEGKDAIEQLPQYSQFVQYQIGIETGKDLARIHRYPAPSDTASWYERKVVKHRRYLDEYAKFGVKIDHERRIFQFIEDHLGLMKDRPNIFQHDDFHLANLLVIDEKYAGVIDFNRYDWGDPIHDFYKVGLFSREISEAFCNGQIRGYYPNQLPENFWSLYALYMALSLVPNVVWILKVAPDELEGMIERNDRIIEDHKGFEKAIPIWFEK